MPKQDFAAQVPGAVVIKQPRAKAAKPALPLAYVAGPTVYPKAKKTWTGYMVAVTLKASTPADAAKAHAKAAARAGYNPKKPLDFKWMLAKGYIAQAV